MSADVLRRHGVFCGSRLPPLVTSEGNSLRIEFSSDNSVQKSGFAAVFFTGNKSFKDNPLRTNLNCRLLFVFYFVISF